MTMRAIVASRVLHEACLVFRERHVIVLLRFSICYLLSRASLFVL